MVVVVGLVVVLVETVVVSSVGVGSASRDGYGATAEAIRFLGPVRRGGGESSGACCEERADMEGCCIRA